MEKPHIKRVGDGWLCRTNGACWGHGESPHQAYLDWKGWHLRMETNEEIIRILLEPITPQKKRAWQWLF